MKTIEDFRRHMATKHTRRSVYSLMVFVRAFVRHIGDVPLDRVTEDMVRGYFDKIPNRKRRSEAAITVAEFLKFAVPKLPGYPG